MQTGPATIHGSTATVGAVTDLSMAGMALVAVMGSLFLYLLICAVLTLAGRAVARLLAPASEEREHWLLAPVLAWSLWILVPGLGTTVCGLPLRVTTPWTWALTAILAGLGIAGATRGGLPRPALLLAITLPCVSQARSFATGLVDSGMTIDFDTPLYLWCGHALWDYVPAQLDPSMGPIYLVARSYTDVWRYGATSLMGLFSGLYTPGEVQTGLGLLVAATLFVTACASLLLVDAFAPTWKAPRRLAVGAALTLSGWLATLYLVGNLDHFVSFPLAMAFLALCVPPRRTGLAAGVPLVALAYAFPDGVAFVAGLGMLLRVLPGISPRPPPARPRIGSIMATGVLVAAALIPLKGLLRTTFHKVLWSCVQAQSGHGLGGMSFSSLTHLDTALPAFWLADEAIPGLSGPAGTGCAWALAVILTGIFLHGLRTCLGRRDWPLLAAVAAGLGSALAAAFGLGYGYLAYKFVTYAFPFVLLATVWGALALEPRLLRILAHAALVVALAIPQARLWSSTPAAYHYHPTAEPWSDVRALATAPPARTMQATVLAVKGDRAAQYAFCTLRHVPLLAGLQRVPMVGWRRQVDEAAHPALAALKYVVTDGGDLAAGLCGAVEPRPVFSNPTYCVWSLRPDWRILFLGEDLSDPGTPPGAATVVLVTRATCTVFLEGRVEGERPPSEVTLQTGGRTIPARVVGVRFRVAVPLPRGLQRCALVARAGRDALRVVDVSLENRGEGTCPPSTPPLRSSKER